MKLNSILFLLLCNSGLQSQTFEYLDGPNFNSIMEQEVVKKFDKIRSTYDPDEEARDYVMDGIVVTAKGKWMDPDCVAKPKVVPAGKPVKIPILSNIRPAGGIYLIILKTNKNVIPEKVSLLK